MESLLSDMDCPIPLGLNLTGSMGPRGKVAKYIDRATPNSGDKVITNYKP